MPKGKTNVEPQMIEMQDLSAAAKKVDMMFEYLGMKKGAGYQIGSNDIMDLRKVYSDYKSKLKNFYRSNKDRKYRSAQYADLCARIEDTETNLRMIDEKIIDGISSNDTDYNNLYKKFNDSISDEDRETEATKNLLTALSEYATQKSELVNKPHLKRSERESIVGARQKLLDCCLDYIKKKPMSDLNAFGVIDEITEAISKEGEKAFGQLTNEDFREFNVRKHLGYISETRGNIEVVHIAIDCDDSRCSKKIEEIMEGHSKEDYCNPEVQGRIEAYFKDLNSHYLYGGGVKYDDCPWNKITFKEYTDSKEAFEKNQERNRNFFGETYGALVNGAFKQTVQKFWETNKNERDIAGGFLSTLNNGDYNGFVRSMKNSDQYEAVLNSLKNFTKESKEDSMQSVGEKRKAVVDACKAYIEHYDEKVRTNKGNSDFAKKRVEKVKELYAAFGGAEVKKEADKEKVSFDELSVKDKGGKTAKVNTEAAKTKEKKANELS